MDEINSLANNGKKERLNRVESIRNGQLLMCDTENINVFVFIDLEFLKMLKYQIQRIFRFVRTQKDCKWSN